MGGQRLASGTRRQRDGHHCPIQRTVARSTAVERVSHRAALGDRDVGYGAWRPDSLPILTSPTGADQTFPRRQGTTTAREAALSQVRVHNFSISLDGFGTGDGITFEAPFGHAGERLHEWMFATRFWRSMVDETGGTVGVDHSFAKRHGLGIG